MHMGCWGEIIDFWRVWKIYLFELCECEWGAWCSKIRYMVICHQLKEVFSSMYVFMSVFIVIFTSPTSYKDNMEVEIQINIDWISCILSSNDQQLGFFLLTILSFQWRNYSYILSTNKQATPNFLCETKIAPINASSVVSEEEAGSQWRMKIPENTDTYLKRLNEPLTT